MKEDATQRISSALFDLNEALEALDRDDKQIAENRIKEAIRKIRYARQVLSSTPKK